MTDEQYQNLREKIKELEKENFRARRGNAKQIKKKIKSLIEEFSN